MTIDRLLQFLVEELDTTLDEKAKAYVDRLLLRFMTSPSLLSFLQEVQVNKEGQTYTVELLFRKVPDDQIEAIKQFIAEESKGYSFEQKGQTHYAFRIQLSSDDLQNNSEQDQSSGSLQ